jgi:hypothetical protein
MSLWWGNLKERDHLQELRTDGWIISTWILKKYDRRAWVELISLKIQAVVNKVISILVHKMRGII